MRWTVIALDEFKKTRFNNSASERGVAVQRLRACYMDHAISGNDISSATENCPSNLSFFFTLRSFHRS